MGQRVTLEPPQATTTVPAKPPVTLHPRLQTTLHNLDVQLEAELARYRRRRMAEQALKHSRAQRSSAPRPLDLITVSAQGGRTQPHPTAPSNPGPTPPPVRAAVTPPTHLPTDLRSLAHDLAQAVAAKSEQLYPEAPAAPEPAVAPESQKPSTPPTAPAVAPASPDPVPPAPPSVSSLVLTPHPATSEESAAEPGPAGVKLDDYLESSEELLQSLAQEEAQVQHERGFMQSLLTPFGLGSMALLLLSSTMLGYLVMNPPKWEDPTVARSPAGDLAQPPSTAPGTATAAPQPNLSDDEFADLTLGSLATLQPAMATPDATPSPTVSPSPTATTSGDPVAPTPESRAAAPVPTSPPAIQRSRPSAPAPVPQRSAPAPRRARARPAPRRQPTVQRRAPAPQPAARKPAPPAPKPATYPYKVQMPYTGDRSLVEARKSVPDAYVRNSDEGATVQLGAFSSKADAEKRRQELQQQGIQAEIQQQ